MKDIIYRDYEENDEENKNKKKINENYQQLNLLRQGTVTEITIGDKVFQVTDPKRIEMAIKCLEQHEESLFKLRQRVKEQSTVINALQYEINAMKGDIQFLRENLYGNSYGSREVS